MNHRITKATSLHFKFKPQTILFLLGLILIVIAIGLVLGYQIAILATGIAMILVAVMINHDNERK